MNWREMELMLCCDYCGALESQRCATKSGKIAKYSHGDRTSRVHKIWFAGFREGIEEAVRNMTDVIDPDKACPFPREAMEQALERLKGWYA